MSSVPKEDDLKSQDDCIVSLPQAEAWKLDVLAHLPEELLRKVTSLSATLSQEAHSPWSSLGIFK